MASALYTLTHPASVFKTLRPVHCNRAHAANQQIPLVLVCVSFNMMQVDPHVIRSAGALAGFVLLLLKSHLKVH